MGFFSNLGSKISQGANWLGRKVGQGAQYIGNKVVDLANAVPFSNPISDIARAAGGALSKTGQALVGGHGGLGGAIKAAEDGVRNVVGQYTKIATG